jgi:RNA polymerase sigma factor (sigma-70 family)
MEFREDSYYIKQVLQGNVNAYSFLVEKYKRMAYTLALKMVLVPEDAEEIAQDGFVKAYQSLRDFKGNSKFSTWLFKIIYNTSVSSLRKKQLEYLSFDGSELRNFDIREADDFLNRLTQEEQNAIIRAAIERLDEEDRALITLYYLNDCTIKEIKDITGDSESNVKIKLYRARKKLWELLKFRLKDQTIEQYEEKG